MAIFFQYLFKPYHCESMFVFLLYSKKLAPVIGSVVGIIVMLGIIIIVVTVICQRRAKALESKERLAARMSGLCEESEITVCWVEFLLTSFELALC